MNLLIELPDDLGRAIKARAEATGVSAASFVSQLLQRSIGSEVPGDYSHQPLQTGYGMWAKYGSAPSAEEIDENRREMFQKFAEDF